MKKLSFPILTSLSILALAAILVTKEKSTPTTQTTPKATATVVQAQPLESPAPQADFASLPRLSNAQSHAELSIEQYKQTIAQGKIREQQWSPQSIAYLESKLTSKSLPLVKKAITQVQLQLLAPEVRVRLLDYANMVVEFPVIADLPHLCWSSDVSPPERQAFESVRFQAIAEDSASDPQFIFQGSRSWSRTATNSTNTVGQPVTITWGFVPDGTTVPTLTTATSTSNLIAKLNSTYGSSPDANDLTQAPWFSYFSEAFGYWSEVTGNQYIYVAHDDGVALNAFNSSGSLGVRGDVRIGGTTLDGNANVLAFNYFPDSGDMVIDTDDSLNFSNNATTIKRFKNVIAHEHGHGLGIDHVCPVDQTKLMEPFASTAFEGVQFDDTLTAHDLYGDPMERHGSKRDNNSLSNATDIGSLSSAGYSASNVSISNSSDTDFYSFSISQAGEIDITVTPTSVAGYLEGSQNSDGSCQVGSLYTPNDRQNLSFQLFAPDGTTVLTSQSSAAIGIAEKVSNLSLPAVGSYTLAVSGGGENSSSSNNAQLYQFQLAFNSVPVSLVGSAYTIETEGCSPANQAVDPNEFVSVSMEVTNNGISTAQSASVTLKGSANLSIIGNTTQAIGAIAAGATEQVTFSFRLAGSCGDLESLTFEMNADTVSAVDYTVPVRIGRKNNLLDENFDSTAVNSLPSGFTNTTTNPTSNWFTSATFSTSPQHSVHSRGVSSVNSAYLTTDSFTAPSDNSNTLNFSHRYDIETTYDGGILEIQIENGSWTEWKDAGGSLNGKDYDTVTIATGFQSPIAGRVGVWSGAQTSFAETQAVFPPAALGKSVRVRWHLASDQTVSRAGWYIDDIQLSSDYQCCNSTDPIVNLSATDGSAEEYDSSNQASVTASSQDPVSQNTAVAYTVSGSASSGADFVALSGIATISASNNSVVIPIQAISDSIVEGEETVIITLQTSANYIRGNTPSASISIQDTPVDGWKKTNFGSNTQNIGDNDDFDGDGIANLLEYAFATNPISPSLSPASQVTLKNGQTVLSLEFTEQTGLSDIVYIAETSTTLQANSWTQTGVTITEISNTNGQRKVTADVAVGAGQRFLRVRVQRNTPTP